MAETNAIREQMSGVMRVYVILLNWNGWGDTIECLESLFRTKGTNFRVVVCDNDSQDDSLTFIKSWADGSLPASTSSNPKLHELTFPPIEKPITYIEYDRATAEAGGHIGANDAALILIRTGGNLGFAGGNNVGLRYVMARGDFEYVWLLNNDTVVKSDTLTALVDRISECQTAGICGSTLLYYTMPEKVQAWAGARYNKWLGTTKMLGAFASCNESIDSARVEAELSYVSGASMVVSRSLLQEVGLMSEEFFLYFEEIDWAMRARGRFQLCYAPKSIVYHKEGGSIGTNSVTPKEKSMTADYYGARGRFQFTWKFFPWCLPAIYLTLIPVLINRARRGQWKRAAMICQLAFGGWRRIGRFSL